MVRNRGRFLKQGESTFNSAFALYIIPKLIPLLEARAPSIARSFQRFLEKTKEAVDKTWNGRWYYRGFDGEGTPIGDGNLFLEHHAWLMIANAIPQNRARVLLHNREEFWNSSEVRGDHFIYTRPEIREILNIQPIGALA